MVLKFTTFFKYEFKSLRIQCLLPWPTRLSKYMTLTFFILFNNNTKTNTCIKYLTHFWTTFGDVTLKLWDLNIWFLIIGIVTVKVNSHQISELQNLKKSTDKQCVYTIYSVLIIIHCIFPPWRTSQWEWLGIHIQRYNQMYYLRLIRTYLLPSTFQYRKWYTHTNPWDQKSCWQNVTCLTILESQIITRS